jgi:hypothetical protein
VSESAICTSEAIIGHDCIQRDGKHVKHEGVAYEEQRQRDTALDVPMRFAFSLPAPIGRDATAPRIGARLLPMLIFPRSFTSTMPRARDDHPEMLPPPTGLRR